MVYTLNQFTLFKQKYLKPSVIDFYQVLNFCCLIPVVNLLNLHHDNVNIFKLNFPKNKSIYF